MLVATRHVAAAEQAPGPLAVEADVDFVPRKAGAERQQVALVPRPARQRRLGQRGVIGAVTLDLKLDVAERRPLADLDVHERVGPGCRACRPLVALGQGEPAARAKAHDHTRMVRERLTAGHRHEAQPHRLLHRHTGFGLDDAAVGDKRRIEGGHEIAIQRRSLADPHLDRFRIVRQSPRQPDDAHTLRQGIETRMTLGEPAVDEYQRRPVYRVESVGAQIGLRKRFFRRSRGQKIESRERR